MDTQSLLISSLITVLFYGQPELRTTSHKDSAEHYTEVWGRFDRTAIRMDDSLLKVATGFNESQRYYMSTPHKWAITEISK